MAEAKLLSLELLKLTAEKIKLIRERMDTAQSRQKSYVDNRRRELRLRKESLYL